MISTLIEFEQVITDGNLYCSIKDVDEQLVKQVLTKPNPSLPIFKREHPAPQDHHIYLVDFEEGKQRKIDYGKANLIKFPGFRGRNKRDGEVINHISSRVPGCMFVAQEFKLKGNVTPFSLFFMKLTVEKSEKTSDCDTDEEGTQNGKRTRRIEEKGDLKISSKKVSPVVDIQLRFPLLQISIPLVDNPTSSSHTTPVPSPTPSPQPPFNSNLDSDNFEPLVDEEQPPFSSTPCSSSSTTTDPEDVSIYFIHEDWENKIG
eukprot:TRINITY_DN3267_c0_g1_i1.p1 TRINITY_DN3267_c0_g1~~TRINITY_DN3267_c0_g1_i1.p1  ORF type:complete len:260 (-),score=53.26 TRINITY_DN3267_c0_g1_i1:164-943(-)